MPWYDRQKFTLKSRFQDQPAGGDSSWTKCDACGNVMSDRDLALNLQVCLSCGSHMRWSAVSRIDALLDDGTVEELFDEVRPRNFLSFSDGKGDYSDKLVSAENKSRLSEAILVVYGQLNGMSVVVGSFDFDFLGGSMGSVVGDRIDRMATYALEHQVPAILFSCSGGARMHEGTTSLMQMAKTCASLARLSDRKIPFISVMTNPTTGGVTASFASVGDLNIAEPGALIGFAGPRVIEQTIREKLPEGFQSSEFLLEHGFLDAIVARHSMKSFLHRVLAMLTEAA